MHKCIKTYSQKSELRIPTATNAPTDVEEYLVEVVVVTAAAKVLVVVVLVVLVLLVAVVVDLI